MTEYPSVCVVTNPIGATGEAVRTLLDVLDSITSVSLVTAHLDERSPIWEDHEVDEFARRGTGDSVLTAAGRFLFNQLRMCWLLLGRNEDVVLFFGATSYLLPVIACRLMGYTVIVQPRGNVPMSLRVKWRGSLPDPIARILAGFVRVLQFVTFALADGIVTYTPEMAKDIGLGCFEDKLYPDGARYVETDLFAIEEPYDDRDRIIGYVGRLEPEKNLGLLAAIVKNLPEDVTFRIVGDGGRRAWLENILREEIDAGRVELLGWVAHDELPNVLNDLRLLVLTSHTEGLPTILLEAMACGTPGFSTPIAGVLDVINPGETGYLIEDYAPEAITTKLEFILDDPASHTVSRQARELVENEYDAAAATERYRTILANFRSDPPK